MITENQAQGLAPFRSSITSSSSIVLNQFITILAIISQNKCFAKIEKRKITTDDKKY